MVRFFDFIKLHLDFKLHRSTIFPIIAALAIVPCIKYLPEQYGYENALLENIQMVVLAIGFFLAIFAKTSKKFFYFAALVIILLAAREINYGRTIFFPVPGEVNVFYSWKEIKYGWIVHPLVGLYMAGTALYFIISKAWCEFRDIVTKVKFPVWNVLLLLIGMVLGDYAERATENFVFEESAELLFYVSLVTIIWLYGYNKKFRCE